MPVQKTIILLLSGILCAAANAEERNWSKWRGPNGNSITDEAGWDPKALEPEPRILWRVNVGCGYSSVCVQGGYAGVGNINQDPLFVNAPGGDYHLKSRKGHWTDSGWVLDATSSPCLDSGDPGDAYGNEPTPHGDRINMGAYGNTVQASKSVLGLVIYVDSGAGGANNGTS